MLILMIICVQMVEGGEQTLQPIAEVPENGSDSGSYQSQVTTITNNMT